MQLSGLELKRCKRHRSWKGFKGENPTAFCGFIWLKLETCPFCLFLSFFFCLGRLSLCLPGVIQIVEELKRFKVEDGSLGSHQWTLPVVFLFQFPTSVSNVALWFRAGESPHRRRTCCLFGENAQSVPPYLHCSSSPDYMELKSLQMAAHASTTASYPENELRGSWWEDPGVCSEWDVIPDIEQGPKVEITFVRNSKDCCRGSYNTHDAHSLVSRV